MTRPPRAHPLPLFLLLACPAPAGDTSDTAPATTSDPTAAAATSSSTTATTGPSSSSSTSTASATSDTVAGTDPAPETDTASDTTGGPLTRCPLVAAPAKLGPVAAPELTEASGLVVSRAQPGVFWAHNDSGDGPRVFALDHGGALLRAFTLSGAAAVDWEDMAIGPGPSPGDWLYLGDIGDNAAARPSITVYRLREPDLARAPADLPAEAIELRYPDQPRDAEALLIDPLTGDLILVAKGDPTRAFRLPAPLAAGGPYTLEELLIPELPLPFVTAGDFAPLGDFIALRGYVQAALWLRPPGATVAQALAAPPCLLPLAAEIQGETLAIAPGGAGYYTVSEGAAPPIWWFAFQ